MRILDPMMPPMFQRGLVAVTAFTFTVSAWAAPGAAMRPVRPRVALRSGRDARRSAGSTVARAARVASRSAIAAGSGRDGRGAGGAAWTSADAAPGAFFLRDGAMRRADPPDTTGSVFDFPEEEEEKKKTRHLARDITVFVIASAFVAAFVIEVFIRGDTDTPVDNRPPGKTVPTN